MMIFDIESNLVLNQVIRATRKSWNGKELDYWAEFSLGETRSIFIAPSTLGTKTFLNSVGFCKLKDGTPVPDAFTLNNEDYEADDWVII